MEILQKAFGSIRGFIKKEKQVPSEDTIREIAYFRWLSETGGTPVGEEESQKYWLEAENELENN